MVSSACINRYKLKGSLAKVKGEAHFLRPILCNCQANVDKGVVRQPKKHRNINHDNILHLRHNRVPSDQASSLGEILFTSIALFVPLLPVWRWPEPGHR